jgi:hypothetical protein
MPRTNPVVCFEDLSEKSRKASQTDCRLQEIGADDSSNDVFNESG